MEKMEGLTGVQSKAEYVYQTLQDKIINGTYPPGTPLSIREISLQMDVSRTPVKEAISRLAFEGYAELLPNRSAMVSRISTAEVLELLELREALERSTAYYAAQRRTEADLAELQRICDAHREIPDDDVMELGYWDRLFHIVIAKASYNNELYQATNRVFEKLTRISLPVGKGRAADTIIQHDTVLAAIRDQNAEEAQRLMIEHNHDVLASIKAYQYQNIHLFK